MPRTAKSMTDPSFLQAALEGLELQRQRIEEQIREVRGMLGKSHRGVREHGGETSPRKRQLSNAARKRIAAAQKKRWAEYRKSASDKKHTASSERKRSGATD
jgi:hypothetical protein